MLKKTKLPNDSLSTKFTPSDRSASRQKRELLVASFQSLDPLYNLGKRCLKLALRFVQTRLWRAGRWRRRQREQGIDAEGMSL